ncbi:helix-turn-helix domain-containing protein [Limnohabitans sp. WS1]|uniref:helix-turn-helix domain-containing protein n=1 Tax=Limnohabitans sp. WS1 TaxID=1100726 RepID=UPI000D367D1E|nr:helix-turn-helix domain-containing protein [Limnohabitans sp. WS1]
MLIGKNPDTKSKGTKRLEAYAIGTAKAAQMLGLSITLVKNLVDQQELLAWKTPGGHRRIDMESIRKYQNKLKKPIYSASETRSLPSISFMVDDALVLKSLKNSTTQWQELIDFNIGQTISEAYLSFSHKIPDILIMKTHMTVDQQIATVVELQNFIEGLPKSLSVIFMTDTQDLHLKVQHKLNPAIQISSDTLNPAWLKAFLMGVMTNPEWH